ncbi:MAG: hypothetical protein NXI32_02035 [bacterium]|nr:hypothetical protein [bacterium]
MTGIDWLIVLLLNGSVMIFGLFLARGKHTSQDWFLGHRSLAWWAIGLSMFATNVDNADLVSLTGTTYREGLHIIMVHTLGSLLGACFAAFYLVPAMARAGQFTNAEYLENRFGPTLRILSALIQIQYRSSMLGLMIWSLFLLLTGLLGLADSTAWMLIIAIVALAGLYTSLGGLKSVVMTDALQGLILFAAVVTVFSAVWQATGGWSQMLSRLDGISLAEGRTAASLARMREYHGDQGQTSAWVVALGWIIIGLGYWSVNHTQTMRLSGARSLWDMKMAAIFGVAVSMPIMVGCASIGLFAKALYPDFETPDNLYPYLADQYLGAGLKGLVVAGIVAAAVSTFDSMSSSLSALFTRDIYARFLNSQRDDAHYVRISQLATAAILISGFAYIPFIRTKETMLQAFLTLIPVFVTPLCGLYLVGVFTSAHRKSGVIGILAGASYGMIALLDREIVDIVWLPAWFTGRWVALLWSFAFTILAAFVTTAVLGKYDRDLPADSTSGWLRESSESLPALPLHPFDRPPAWWLRPETLAGLLIVVTLYILWTFFW